MAREVFEFTCKTECGKIFDINLNLSLNGKYRINCPNCNHKHYRWVKDGKITEERFPDRENDLLAEDIWPMRSSCRDFAKEKQEDYVGPRAFLSSLWNRSAAAWKR
jgi:DNA-directed RNA polymerase subunit RPC12/RpoP